MSRPTSGSTVSPTPAVPDTPAIAGRGRGHIRAAGLVGALTVAGALLGFVRDLTIARFFGATAETDAFFVAWTIPETASPLLMEGAMAALLVPLFSHELTRVGSFKAALSGVLLPLLGVLVALTALTAVGASVVVDLLAPGIAERELAIRSVRVTSLTVLMIGLSGYCMAALRSKDIFGWPASVYVAYNVGIITVILVLHERLGVFSASVGLAVGAALMIAIQLPVFVRAVGVPRPTVRLPAELRERLSVFVPLASFTIARHGQVYVERVVGSLLSAGTLSQLNYAAKVGQIPMLLALTVSAVTFPALSRAAAAGEEDRLRSLAERNLRLVTFLLLPAMAVLIVFPGQIVAMLFERGAFTSVDTDATAEILRVYSLGLLGQVLVGVSLQILVAVPGKTWRPARSAALGLVLTALIAVPAAALIGAPGIALGNALGISLMAVLMLRSMQRRGIALHRARLTRHFARCGAAALAASVVAVAVGTLTKAVIAGALLDVSVLVLGGGSLVLVYLLLARAMRVEEAGGLLTLARRLRPRASSTD